MRKSNFLSWNKADFIRGFIMAILSVVVTGVYTSLTAIPPRFPNMSELQTLGMVGLASGVAYLIKNFFTNSDNQILKKE